MNKYLLWSKISNYSIVVCGIVLVLKMFLRKYFENAINFILIIGAIALLILYRCVAK